MNERYPIGKFEFSGEDDRAKSQYLQAIREAPRLLREAVAELNDEQLNTPYREGGWTVRQVVHHMVDSHMNSYIRFRWALTEDKPVIKAYDEAVWAALPDAKSAPIELSLDLLEALHARWLVLLENLSPEDLARVFVHPETGREIPLIRNLAIYAWHGKHHVAHITELRKRKGWT